MSSDEYWKSSKVCSTQYRLVDVGQQSFERNVTSLLRHWMILRFSVYGFSNDFAD